MKNIFLFLLRMCSFLNLQAHEIESTFKNEYLNNVSHLIGKHSHEKKKCRPIKEKFDDCECMDPELPANQLLTAIGNLDPVPLTLPKSVGSDSTTKFIHFNMLENLFIIEGDTSLTFSSSGQADITLNLQKSQGAVLVSVLIFRPGPQRLPYEITACQIFNEQDTKIKLEIINLPIIAGDTLFFRLENFVFNNVIRITNPQGTPALQISLTTSP